MTILNNLSASMLVLSILVAPIAAGADEPQTTPRVSNGTPCLECGFGPSVVSLRRIDYSCTGTLIHPQVVLYAAHCGKFGVAEFAHKFDTGRLVNTAYCATHPDYDGTTSPYDFAYCILQDPVTDIPHTPPAYGCELDEFIKVGQKVHLCGFGYQTNDDWSRNKVYGVSQITEVSGNGGYGKITIGPYNGVVACPGDSGGPALVQTEDGSWRTIGVTSTYNYECGLGGKNWFVAVRTGVEWIELETGIDVTPCFDTGGKWNPGADCHGFWAGNEEPHGTWANGCEGTPISGVSETCAESDSDTDTDTDSDTDTVNDSDSATDTDSDTTTDTETDTDTDSVPSSDDDGCGCSQVGQFRTGFKPVATMLRILMRGE